MGTRASHIPVVWFSLARQGAFDSFTHEHLPRTKYDIIVDETSNKPEEQAFEVQFHSYLALISS
jgi:hypothetical protein